MRSKTATHWKKIFNFRPNAQFTYRIGLHIIIISIITCVCMLWCFCYGQIGCWLSTLINKNGKIIVTINNNDNIIIIIRISLLFTRRRRSYRQCPTDGVHHKASTYTKYNTPIRNSQCLTRGVNYHTVPVLHTLTCKCLPFVLWR